MAIPSREDLRLPILIIAGDGNEHNNQELYNKLAAFFGLTEEERKERSASDRDFIFNNHVRFACVDLRNAGLLSSPRDSVNSITEQGRITLQISLRQFKKAFRWY